jgi:hypothetical protein
LTTSNKDFRVKNGLIVDGATATVNGNNVLTSASSINALGDVVITDVSTGQVLKWNGTSWINDTDATGAGGGGNSFTTFAVPSGTNPVADSATDTITFADGANIGITGDATSDTITVAVDADLTGITSIGTPSYITLDTIPTGVPSTVGTISWDTDNETVNILLNGVNLQVGQEHIVRVKNNSGSVAIPDRTLVMFAGATGDTVTVAPAITDDVSVYPSDYIVGITTEEIPADGFGFVTQFGFINQVDTSAWTVGTLLYPDPTTPGGFVATKPDAPAWQTPIAAVTKQNIAAGRIFVRAIPGIQLNSIENVQITSVTDNEVLAYDSTSGTWINQTAEEAGLATISGTTFTGAVAMNGGFSVDSTAFSVADTTGNTSIAGTLGVAGIFAANGGITGATAKNMTVASSYSGSAFNGTKVVMTASQASATAPTTRPDTTALSAGDIWISW